MKGKERSKIKEDIVKDLEKIIEAIEKAARIVFPRSDKNKRAKNLSNYLCVKEDIKEDLNGHLKYKVVFFFLNHAALCIYCIEEERYSSGLPLN